MKIYPLARADDIPVMISLNGSGKAIDASSRTPMSILRALAALGGPEPAYLVPPSDRFLLASIGIRKDKPFMPL